MQRASSDSRNWEGVVSHCVNGDFCVLDGSRARRNKRAVASKRP